MGSSPLPPLSCPVDRSPCRIEGAQVLCAQGHSYPILEGIPIMLREDVEPTHPYMGETLRLKEKEGRGEGVSEQRGEGLDPFVVKELVASCGLLYRKVQGRLSRYPIPEDLPVPEGEGKWFLDIGSNWGRWAIAAARKGYRVVGLDPSLRALLAMGRVGASLGYELFAVSGDARYLPFPEGYFDLVFSYSVFQHFAKEAARRAVEEAVRVCKPGGTILFQMPNRFGLRQMYHEVRFYLRPSNDPFRVRYWTPWELKALGSRLGRCELMVDGFFSLNPRPGDADLLPWYYALGVRLSTWLKGCSRIFPGLMLLADSLWVKVTKVPS